MLRRGRPGLLGTAARTAVVVGTANAVTRRGQQRAMDRQQAEAFRADQAAAAAAPAAPAAPAPEPAAAVTGLAGQLAEIAKLRDAGVLTEEEFSAAKARLLTGG